MVNGADSPSSFHKRLQDMFKLNNISSFGSSSGLTNYRLEGSRLESTPSKMFSRTQRDTLKLPTLASPSKSQRSKQEEISTPVRGTHTILDISPPSKFESRYRLKTNLSSSKRLAEIKNLGESPSSTENLASASASARSLQLNIQQSVSRDINKLKVTTSSFMIKSTKTLKSPLIAQPATTKPQGVKTRQIDFLSKFATTQRKF